MPPKKKASKNPDPAKFVDKENLKRAEAEIVSLQRLLEVRSLEVQPLVLSCHDAVPAQHIVQLPWDSD